MKNIWLIALTIISLQLFSQHNTPSRSVLNPAYAPFYHGVASGDPLTDRVILWTRITTSASTDTVQWQIATDADFNNIVNNGTVTTDATKDFTVKVDATGLQANTWYYYRFAANGVYSVVGRTRTAPVNGVNNLRFAVVSCARFPNGYFHVYRDIVNRNEVDAVLHLGDYIYESGKLSAVPNDTSRNHMPDNEPLTLADYRIRHSQYKLDPDLRDCHRQFPFIAVWDDHETANDSWRGGAAAHDTTTEGNWYNRKDAGMQAYNEWMPIRSTIPNNDSVIYRNMKFGNLADVVMIDTRLEGRDKQIPGLFVSPTDSSLNDTTRRLMSTAQMNWLNNEVKNSTATWKIIGNQVMVAPLTVNSNIVNPDQWDGYPYERKKVLDNILNNNIQNVVFITGDIHCSWANDVPYDTAYNPQTGAGSTAVEFVTTSITSGSELPGFITSALIQSSNPHMKYIELTKRGYVLLDVTEQRVQGDWRHVSDIKLQPFTTTTSASWQVNKGERFLRLAMSPIGAKIGMPALVPDITSGITTTKPNLVSLHCFPNPFTKEIFIQYYLFDEGLTTAVVFDKRGRKVFEQTLPGNTVGLHEAALQLEKLSKGTYTLQIATPKGIGLKEVMKID
ncbi:MAG: alkaline phosphatase D family protein [Chitinophagales bacterium]